MEAAVQLLKQRTAELNRVQGELFGLRASYDALRSQECHPNIRSELQRLRKEIEYKDDRIGRIEVDYDKLYKRKQEISETFFIKEDDSLRKIEKNFDLLQKETSRYRKERDEMREMYETANSQVSSLSKNCSHLQLMIDGLKSKFQLLESKSHNDSKLSSDEALIEELSSIEKAYELLRDQNESLIKDCVQKEASLNTAAAEKIKSDFRMAQVLKDAEMQLKKAEEIESLSLAKLNSSLLREKSLLSQISSLENDLTERTKSIEDMKKKIIDLSHSAVELEKEKRNLKGDLDDPIFIDLKRQYDSIYGQFCRLKEDHELLDKRYTNLRKKNSSGASEAEEELQLYKKLLKCNSCHLREKSAVLVKCMHVFCRQCLEDRVDTRQRKCPNCGESFAASDIRNIYL